ncbi:putative mediator of RNA polymerase II transcription subunit 26 [Drosophila albomicans]|uniref:Mediator of RNA polymerase II transcription subunit 26 n=1 Tax=Drosophila albomicans TaxID=7291 RepID=A0A6P8XKJ8_DROAB|nr:putative mediator of RNA polymerase II transcription subunit 26 [Drosophila albomicans]
MAFLKVSLTGNQLLHTRPSFFSILSKSYGTFRQALPNFPFPSAVNINRHQAVKSRPVQKYRYLTSKLETRKSKNYVAFIDDECEKKKLDKKQNSKLHAEQLKKLMFNGSENDITKPFVQPKFLQKQELKDQLQAKFQLKLQQQEQQQKKKQSLTNVNQFYQDERKTTSNPLKRLKASFVNDASIELLPMSLPQLQPPKQQSQQQQQQPKQQEKHATEANYYERVLRTQMENMQRIKERDKEIKNHFEKFKVYEKMNQLMKQAHDAEDNDNDNASQPKSYKISTTIARERQQQHHIRNVTRNAVELQLLRSTHLRHTPMYKQTVTFAPYTPVNDSSDNGDIIARQRSSKSKQQSSPQSEYHAFMKSTRAIEMLQCDSVLYKLCKNSIKDRNSKY